MRDRCPAKLRLGRGRESHASLDPLDFFIARCIAPPIPSCPGQSFVGSGGKNLRRGADVVCGYGKSSRLCRGAGRPPVPPPVAIGAGMDNLAGMSIHHFSSRDAPLGLSSPILDNRTRGSGGKNPRREDERKRMNHARIRKSDDFYKAHHRTLRFCVGYPRHLRSLPLRSIGIMGLFHTMGCEDAENISGV